MKKTYLITLIALLNFMAVTVLNAQDWTFARAFGSQNNDQITAVATDAARNTYIAGHFSGTLNIPGFNLLNSVSGLDVFIAKIDSDGNLKWVHQAGGSGADFCEELVVDSDGKIYVTVNFYNDITFTSSGMEQPEPVIVDAGDDPNQFIISNYSPQGVFQYGRYTSETYPNYVTSMAFGGDSYKLLVTGYSVFDDMGTPSDLDDDDDAFLYEIDLFTTTFRIIGSSVSYFKERGTGVAIDNNGDLIMCGYFDTRLDLFDDPLGVSGNGTEVFLAKYRYNAATDSYNFLWVKSAGSSGEDVGTDVALDAQGNIYVSGLFQDDASFGPFNADSNGSTDFFVAKYNQNGGIEWVNTGGSDDIDFAIALDVSSNGDVYYTGTYKGSCLFDNHTIQSNNNSDDIYIISYDKFGDIKWYKNVGSLNEDAPQDIELTQFGEIALVGYFSNSIQFGEHGINVNALTDGFLAFLDPNTPATDLEEIPIAEQLHVYPNPTSDILYLDTENIADIKAVDIFRADGTLIAQQEWTNIKDSYLDVSLFPVGLYHLRIVGDADIQTKAFIVQR